LYVLLLLLASLFNFFGLLHFMSSSAVFPLLHSYGH
jgi:hypothetical protein